MCSFTTLCPNKKLNCIKRFTTTLTLKGFTKPEYYEKLRKKICEISIFQRENGYGTIKYGYVVTHGNLIFYGHHSGRPGARSFSFFLKAYFYWPLNQYFIVFYTYSTYFWSELASLPVYVVFSVRKFRVYVQNLKVVFL
ncbi:hypothetical protein BD770DRAFT_412249 [Pilaira anomala]|nr:hypothetical protein BD770DRAFT_412249 [Pilaira anomala]